MAGSGEILDIDRLAAPPVPPEQNGLQQLTWIAGQLSAFPLQLYPPAAKYAAPGKVIVISKLNEWPDANSRDTNITWVNVAEQLAPLEGLMQEALDILAEKRFNANLHYRSGFSLLIPHLARLKSVSQILSAAALEDLHQGQPESAFAKLNGMLALAQAEKDEPILISQLVRIAITHLTFAATWQVLQHDGWTDSQLTELQTAWADLTFLHEMEKALSMERAIAAIEYERFRTSDLPLSQLFDPTGTLGGGGTGLPFLSWDWFSDMLKNIPATLHDQVYTPIWKFAWSHHDELHYCKLMQRMLVAERETVLENAGAKLPARMERIYETAMSPYDRMRFAVAPLMYGSLSKAFERAWIAQATAELTTTAIAIKRFELRHGKTPNRLEDLMFNFLSRLPIDYMDGRCLKYCIDDDSFLLYSVGIDGKDDGGNGDQSRGSNPNFQNGQDLVWPQPASELEILMKWSSMRPATPERRRR